MDTGAAAGVAVVGFTIGGDTCFETGTDSGVGADCAGAGAVVLGAELKVGLLPPMFRVIVGGGGGASSCTGLSIGCKSGGAG